MVRGFAAGDTERGIRSGSEAMPGDDFVTPRRGLQRRERIL
jgi:hypothetical protein